MPAKPSQVAKPPSRAMETFTIVGGIFMLATAVPGLFIGGGSSGWWLLVFGVFVTATGIWQRRVGSGAQFGNLATAAISAGRFAEALSLLEAAERAGSRAHLTRFVQLQRAGIHLRLGQLEQAVAQATRAIERPVSWVYREGARAHVAEARALRAFALAGLGRGDAAREDIAAVRDDEFAGPAVLARAEVAEAIVLERAGDRAALRAHITSKRYELLEYATPRERAVVRAYQRMLRVTPTTPYRESAADEGATDEAADGEEPELADWVASVAPGTARFVERSPPAGTPPKPVTVGAAARAAVAKRFAVGWAGAARFAAIIGVSTVIGLAAWRRLEPVLGDWVPSSSLLQLLLYLAVLGMIFVPIVMVGRRVQRRVLDAQGKLSRGDLVGARAGFESLRRSWHAMLSAQGCIGVATLAARANEWDVALAATEVGLRKVRSSQLHASLGADGMLPALHVAHATALVSLGRVDEADAEMALLAEAFPAFPLLPAAQHAHALTAAVKRRRLKTAARVAASATTDLALSVRVELLGAVVMATRLPERVSAPELERIRDELRLDAPARRWIETLNPSLLRAFSEAHGGIEEPPRPAARARLAPVAVRDLDRAAAPEAEAEAEAEAQATQPSRPRRRQTR